MDFRFSFYLMANMCSCYKEDRQFLALDVETGFCGLLESWEPVFVCLTDGDEEAAHHVIKAGFQGKLSRAEAGKGH